MKFELPKFDLRSQLILWMVIVSILPLILITYGLFYNNYVPFLKSFLEFNYSLLHRHLLIEQASEAGRLADQIDTVLSELKNQGVIMGQLASASFLSASEKNRLLYNFISINRDIDCIVIRSIEDQVRSVNREGTVISNQLQGMLSDPVLFQRTMAGEVAFSEPFVLEELEELAMVISMPILSDTGKAMGALYMQIDLERIQKLTESANKINPGIIYVVDSEGKLVGHVDRNRVLEREDMRDLEIVKNYLIPRITAGSIPYKDKSGRDVQGAYAPVGDLRWGVVTERLQVNAFSTLNEIKYQADQTMGRLQMATLIGVLSAAILAIGMGALLAVRITSPIREIANGAIEIAKGDFSKRFSVKSSPEIEQLALTLNYMSQAIEKYTVDLEKNVKNLRELFKGSVESLTAAIDAKDPYTRGHSRRVTTISLLIGKQLDLPKDQMEELEISAMMHDIGKIGIDDAILKKPGMVTEEELNVLKEHPKLGALIMKPIPQLGNMINGMLHHHERWDGTGYPEGLKGEEISVYGRIIAVADTFDAMTSDRPYQETHSFEHTRDQISEWRGTRYDPAVVDAFLLVFDDICQTVLIMRE
ncbi:HD domain-containing protein [bacterium]|nr:HD domain-containing protein [candidate division CSSED10-310 bacterium]